MLLLSVEHFYASSENMSFLICLHHSKLNLITFLLDHMSKSILHSILSVLHNKAIYNKNTSHLLNG